MADKVVILQRKALCKSLSDDTRVTAVEELVAMRAEVALSEVVPEFLCSGRRQLVWTALSAIWWIDRTKRMTMVDLVKKHYRSKWADVRREARAFLRQHAQA